MIRQSLALALLLSQAATSQSPAGQPAQPTPPRPTAQQAATQQAAQQNPILEGVAVQAGESLVTLGEFERHFRRRQEAQPPDSRESEERLYRETLLELWTARLEAQKGADLGLDPAQIEKITRANLEAEREKAGLEVYLAQLREEGKDALAEESERQEQIRRDLWKYSALGNAVVARRATRDATIRPGELRAMFEENKQNLAEVTVQLRWLVVSSRESGSPEAARASCEDARARVLAGEDLALLVEERGADLRDSRGLLPFRAPSSFADPDVAAFADKAGVGELTEVSPLSDRNGQPAPELGYRLIQLHDRRVPPEPDFDAPDVQRLLTRYFANERRERILGRERARLHREAYAWVNPLAGVPEVAAPRP
ncbi:MAG: peptidylprolyl isomerase [Planctomycetes bacterium]|nr:peptidylprolyl isomerase [Planctomycetota bacterium]